MNKLFIAALVALSALNSPAGAQQLLAEVGISKTALLKSVNGVTQGDSIFLIIDEYNTSTQQAFWILPDGQKRKIDVNQLGNKTVCGISEGGRMLYFFDQERKQVILKCMEIDTATARGTVLSGQVIIPGKMLGSYREHGSLFLICVEKGSYQLKILELRDLRIVSEKEFTLTHKLLDKNLNLSKAFILAGSYVKPVQAKAGMKIFKYPDEIFITIDQIPNEYVPEGEEPPGTVFKTTVIRLDLRTGGTTTRSYFESARHNFCTYVFGQRVYRLVNGVDLSVWDFDSNAIMEKIQFTKENFPAYSISRNDGDNTIEKNVTNSPGGNFIIVDSLDSGVRTMMVGYIYDNTVGLPFMTSFGLAGALMPFFGAAVINETSNGPYSINYSYLKEPGFLSPQRRDLRGRIDDFELSNFKCSYKGYLRYADGIYGIYRENRTNTLRIFKFKKGS